MVHAVLLLLMLEAVIGPRFTISLKRSTQNLQLSTSWAGRLSHLSGEERKLDLGAAWAAFDPLRTFPAKFWALVPRSTPECPKPGPRCCAVERQGACGCRRDRRRRGARDRRCDILQIG